NLNPHPNKNLKSDDGLRTSPSPRFIKRGKTTIHRYSHREFHRFEEIQGKTVDYAEVYTSGEYHSIAIYFQDKTLFHFTIDLGFTLEPQYADMKTGARVSAGRSSTARRSGPEKIRPSFPLFLRKGWAPCPLKLPANG